MENFTFKNYTPHAVTIGDLTIAAEAQAIRLEQKDSPIFTKAGIPCTIRRYGSGSLPAQTEGIGLIVSQIVAAAFPERSDLFFPGDLLRDDKGNIIGCTSLCQVSEASDKPFRITTRVYAHDEQVPNNRTCLQLQANGKTVVAIDCNGYTDEVGEYL